MWDEEQLQKIYDKAKGHCTYCGKQIVRSRYGRREGRGIWEVDHSKPKSRGGTDHPNNLVASCVNCNRKKGDMTSAEFKRMRV